MKTSLITLITLLFTFTTFAQTSSNSIIDPVMVENLQGRWLFSIGDKPDYAKTDCNTNNWDTIWVPMNWEAQGYMGYNGFAWYRKNISISNVDDYSELTLRIDHIDDIDETYFNGVLIGSTGSLKHQDKSYWAAKRIYKIPKELIRENNTIAIRVYDNHLPGGITFGKVGIYGTLTYQAVKELEGVWLHNTAGKDFADADVKDSRWEQMILPGEINFKADKKFDSEVWCRKHFVLKADPTCETYVLVLGKLNASDRVYLNGELIGSTWHDKPELYMGNRLSDDRFQLRAYYFKADLLNDDENVLSIQLGLGGTILSHTGPIVIMSQDEYSKLWMKFAQFKRHEHQIPDSFKGKNHDAEFVRSLTQ